jgi:hypothetical protein
VKQAVSGMLWLITPALQSLRYLRRVTGKCTWINLVADLIRVNHWLPIRFSNFTFTVLPASFPIARRISSLTGSMCLPSPMAMNELWKGCPSIVPVTLTKPRVPKKLD